MELKRRRITIFWIVIGVLSMVGLYFIGMQIRESQQQALHIEIENAVQAYIKTHCTEAPLPPWIRFTEVSSFLLYENTSIKSMENDYGYPCNISVWKYMPECRMNTHPPDDQPMICEKL